MPAALSLMVTSHRLCRLWISAPVVIPQLLPCSRCVPAQCGLTSDCHLEGHFFMSTTLQAISSKRSQNQQLPSEIP